MAGAIFLYYLESFATVCNTFFRFSFKYILSKEVKLTTWLSVCVYGVSVRMIPFSKQFKFQTFFAPHMKEQIAFGRPGTWAPGRPNEERATDVDSLPTLTFTGAKRVSIGSEFVVVCCKFYAQEKCFETRKKNKMLYFQTFAFFFLVSFANIWTYSQLREWLVVVFAIGPAIDGLVFFYLVYLVDFATRLVRLFCFLV